LSQCAYCGAAFEVDPPPAASVAQQTYREPAPSAAGPARRDWSELKPYYQVAFNTIEREGGGMTVSWNWAAFFFPWIWYLYRGMVAKGLIALLLSLATSGAAWLFISLYAGLYGNYDFYLLKAKDKQLW